MPSTGCWMRFCGRVQGVGFRFFVRHQAQSRRLFGWVQNMPDGCVELTVFGDEKTVLDFESAVQNAPWPIRISQFQKDTVAFEDHWTSFETR